MIKHDGQADPINTAWIAAGCLAAWLVATVAASVSHYVVHGGGG